VTGTYVAIKKFKDSDDDEYVSGNGKYLVTRFYRIGA